jgi:hypothetical protein
MSGAGTLAAAQPAPDPIASVRAFAEQYQGDAPSLVAHEAYVQNVTYRTGRAAHRVTTAELVMVRLQGAAGWISFRDVLSVDKRPIGDRQARLLKLLQSPQPTAQAQAREIARFNLGTLTRT